MSSSNPNLIVQFNFEKVEAGKAIDQSGKHHDGLVQGGKIVFDDEFGSCLSFNGKSDHISLPGIADVDYSRGFTLEAWVWFASVQSFSCIFDLGGKQEKLLLSVRYGKLALTTSRGNENSELASVKLVDKNDWTHVAATVDAGGNSVLYINGEPAASSPVVKPGTSQPRQSTIGKSGDRYLEGKVASARIYDRGLSADEIRRDMHDDETASATFRSTYPLQFHLYDAQTGEPIIYITDVPEGRRLTLEISNESHKAISLAPPASSDVSALNHHFELLFRPGTLSSAALKRLELDSESLANHWLLRAGDVQKSGGYISLYILNSAGLTLKPNDKLRVSLKGAAAELGAGERSTRCELKFRQVHYPGDPAQLKGPCTQLLSVISHLGQKTTPLHAVLINSNKILNDGSENELTLIIANRSDKALSLNAAQPKFIISFDVKGNDDTQKDWALTRQDNAENIGVEPTKKDWKVERLNAAEWKLTTSKSEIGPGEEIEVTFSKIKSLQASGTTNLYVRYMNIAGHWGGEFIVPIEKSHLAYKNRRLTVDGIHARGEKGGGDPAIYWGSNQLQNYIKDYATFFRPKGGQETIRGACIFGSEGGLLGTTKDSANVALHWDQKGNVRVHGEFSSHGVSAPEKHFSIPHPVKTGHQLIHACLEGPELAVYYRGSGRLTKGKATVKLPDYFEALTLKQDRTVTLTAKGREPYLLSYEDIHDGQFEVYGTKSDGEFSWEVKAVRSDVEHLQVEVKT